MAFDRSLHFVLFGQSYVRAGYEYQPAYATFCTAIKRAINTDAAAITTNTGVSVAAQDVLQRRQHATDGTAVLAANAGSMGYWVEDDGTTPGPRLSAAVSAIGGYATRPVLAVYSHGEQDATKVTTQSAANDVVAAMADTIIPDIRAAIDAGAPTDVPVWLDMLGPRYPGDELGEYMIRDGMIGIVEAGTNLFRGAEKYALQLGQDTHPTPAAYQQMGAHTGRKVANWLVNQTDLRGPSITSPVLAGSNVTVTINVPSGKTLIKPSRPTFFGLFDESDAPIEITGYAWIGNDLTLTCASPPAKLRYPVRPDETLVDITRIIRLSSPSDPVYDGEHGLVLESMVTHVF